MSSFVVGSDHIDYLVSAVLAYVPHRLGARTPDELGHLLLSENIATVTGRYLDADDDDLDEDELEELAEEKAAYDELLAAYRFRPVAPVDPAQAASVAACWQYQRTRQGPFDVPETWAIADEVSAAALALVAPTALRDPAGPRTFDNLRTDELAWTWSRPRS